MNELIEALPQYILYIVLGFIFLRIFRYMSTIKNSNNYDHIIWESIVVGFILNTLYKAIPFSINQPIDTIGMIIGTIFAAGLSAKLYSCKHIDKGLRKLGIYRTRNTFIWQDIEDKDNATYINAVNPETNEAYSGMLKYYEDFERNPQIILQNYKYWEDWHNKTPTLDFSNEPEYTILIDTTVFSRITVIYLPESEKVKNND